MAHDPDSPLAHRLSAEGAAQRDDLARPAFDASDYERLAQQASEVERRLVRLDPEAGAGMAAQRRLFEDVLRLLRDPRADAVAPPNDEIYGAALDVSQIGGLIAQFGDASDAWRRLLVRALGPAGTPVQVATLRFGAVCRGAGIRVQPSDGPAEASMEIAGWKIGVGVRRPEGPDGFSASVRGASEALARARQPGLIVVELSSVLAPSERLNLVADDVTAAGEMHVHLDRFLIEHRDEMIALADTSFAFGVVAGATMSARVATTRRIVFATSWRAINLCEVDDPRAPKLARFMEQFSRAGG